MTIRGEHEVTVYNKMFHWPSTSMWDVRSDTRKYGRYLLSDACIGQKGAISHERGRHQSFPLGSPSKAADVA